MGFTPEESLKRDLADNTTPNPWPRLRRHCCITWPWKRTLRPTPTDTDTRAGILPQGRFTVWLEQHVNGIRDADGTLVGFHGVPATFTERKRRSKPSGSASKSFNA